MPVVQASFDQIELNGISIHYARWGEAESGKPAAVLLHATGLCGMVWRRVAEGLSDRYCVYALDRRAQGRSGKTKPAGGYNFREFSKDTVAFIDALGLAQVYLIGHSGGASDGLVTAAARPGAVARVFALEPIVPTPEWRRGARNHPHAMSEIARRRRGEFESREAALQRWTGRPPFDTWETDVLRDYVEYGFEELPDGTVRLLCPPQIEASIFDGAGELDVTPELRAVQCPALIAVGERSGEDMMAMARRTVAAIGNAELYTFPGATHFIPMEMPEAVARKALEFAAGSVPR